MNWNQALFPSLKRRGGCATKKMSRSNLSSRRRGGAKRKPDRAQPQEKIGEIFRPEEFAELTTRSAALRRLRAFLLMPHPPLLFKEGNVSALKRSDALGYDLDAASRLGNSSAPRQTTKESISVSIHRHEPLPNYPDCGAASERLDCQRADGPPARYRARSFGRRYSRSGCPIVPGRQNCRGAEV